VELVVYLMQQGLPTQLSTWSAIKTAFG